MYWTTAEILSAVCVGILVVAILCVVIFAFASLVSERNQLERELKRMYEKEERSKELTEILTQVTKKHHDKGEK